jgi:2,5-furandicarboxylate decarboxylase 1
MDGRTMTMASKEGRSAQGEEPTLRTFLSHLEKKESVEFHRIKEPVALDYEISAIAMEMDRLKRSPVLLFENVKGSKIPVLANLFASRANFAAALGIDADALIEEMAKRNDQIIEPVLVDNGPVHDIMHKGEAADLSQLPIMLHFAQDAGRYITNAVVIAKDPDTGVRNASFHRMQIKGPRRLGTSLHSRRHLWNYVERNDAKGEPTPILIVVGAHPLFTFGGIWKGPINVDEYAVVGGLMGRGLEIVPALTVPLEAPAQAEIVIEGHILPNVREPEGPFAEFTGYASERSTQHVVEVTAITHRRDAIYHDIVPGISEEHTLLLAVPQEARLLRTLRQHYQNVTQVAYPKSGTCRMHAYIAMKNAAPGQAKNAAAVALGDDLSLKMVVVVDDDVNVLDDSDVLWAMCTRMQADEDISIIRNAMGAILDPSNNNGLTAKMIIDATRPKGHFPQRHTFPSEAVARAREIIGRMRR